MDKYLDDKAKAPKDKGKSPPNTKKKTSKESDQIANTSKKEEKPIPQTQP